jgi:hypothetical protein
MHQQLTLSSEETNVLSPLIAPISRLTVRVGRYRRGGNLPLNVKHVDTDIQDNLTPCWLDRPVPSRCAEGIDVR